MGQRRLLNEVLGYKKNLQSSIVVLNFQRVYQAAISTCEMSFPLIHPQFRLCGEPFLRGYEGVSIFCC